MFMTFTLLWGVCSDKISIVNIPTRAYFLTLPNSDSARSPSQSSHGKHGNVENFVLLQLHGNTFVTLQRFQV